MGFNECNCCYRTGSAKLLNVQFPLPWFSVIFKLLKVTLLLSVIISCVNCSLSSTEGDSEFKKYLPPTITVRHGDRIYEKQSLVLHVNNIEEHDYLYFSCKAPYPIEWALAQEANPSALGRMLSTHLSTSRSFSDFYDKSSYIFIITSRIVRYKKISIMKPFRFSCQAIENPEELCLPQSVSLNMDKDHNVTVTLSTINDVISSEENEDLCKKTKLLSHRTKDVSRKQSSCESFIYFKQLLNQDADESDENHVDLHIHGPKYSFMCSFPNGKPGMIKVSYCSNAMVCNNQFKKTRLPMKCVKAVDDISSNSSTKECGTCQEKITRLFSGFIGCVPVGEYEKKPDSQLFIFSSVPQEGSNNATIEFSMETSSAEDEMISLSEVPQINYIGDQLTVTCNVSNYYFAGGTRLALKYKNEHELTFLKSVHKGIHDPVHNNGFGVEEAAIPIMSDSLERVYCFAPVWNSFSWVNKSRKINIEDDTKILKAVAFTFSVAVVIFASFFGIFWVLIVNRKNAIKLLSNQEIQVFYKGNMVKYKNALLSTYDEVYVQSAYDASCEIQRDRLLLDETAVLGQGHFGTVMKGVLKDEKLGTNNVEVAVKTIKTKMDVACLKALLSELKIMASIGKHPNVVNLLGACTKKIAKGEVFVAVEFCHKGNLQNYLRKHRQNFHNQVVRDIIVIELDPISQAPSLGCSEEAKDSGETITTLDLVKWSWEIARGMEFLSSKKVIHGDVATRNILLTVDKIAKVSDFGLSRQLVDYYYVKKETGPMPWKWMAIESLRDMKFSIQSDVWSFGITLWEIFTLAEVPYTGCSWSAEFVITLLSGHRLGRPPFATSEIYDLMRECWNNEPSERPSFFSAKLFFEDILAQTSNQDYMQIENFQEIPLEDCFQKLPLLRITEALSPEEDEVFE